MPIKGETYAKEKILGVKKNTKEAREGKKCIGKLNWGEPWNGKEKE